LSQSHLTDLVIPHGVVQEISPYDTCFKQSQSHLTNLVISDDNKRQRKQALKVA